MCLSVDVALLGFFFSDVSIEYHHPMHRGPFMGSTFKWRIEPIQGHLNPTDSVDFWNVLFIGRTQPERTVHLVNERLSLDQRLQ